MRFEGMAARPDAGLLIQLQKPRQSAAVVIVPVRYDGCIYGAQICSHAACICGKGRGCPGVEENALTAGLNQKTQAVFRYEIRVTK